jgi:hypothetical protein
MDTLTPMQASSESVEVSSKMTQQEFHLLPPASLISDKEEAKEEVFFVDDRLLKNKWIRLQVHTSSSDVVVGMRNRCFLL